jgi:glycosyltransferase involved in cell wall biosynthesis
MADRLYSIVIPTRERADVLHFAIGTVLGLTRPNYELIVMDNCGSEETRRVVEAFASPRIRYFRSAERLSMADNWERGLDQATGDYVTFLGDDDGLLPDAIELAERFHADRPDEILSWWPFMWLWPDALPPDLRNLAQMHFGAHVQRFDSREVLKDVLAYRLDWTSLPTLYCSFVPRGLLDRMRRAQGRYFLAALPDVFSGIANLFSTEAYFYAYRPLSCWGISRHSTGASQYFRVGAAADRFDAELADGDAWHPRIAGAGPIVEARVFDVYLKAKDRLFPEDGELEIDMAALLRQIAARAARRFDSGRRELQRAVDEMARRNGLDPADFPLAPADRSPVDRFGYHSVPGAESVVRYYHFTDPAWIRTIGDFVGYAVRMCVPQEQVRIPPRSPSPEGAPASLAPLRRAARMLRRVGRALRK